MKTTTRAIAVAGLLCASTVVAVVAQGPDVLPEPAARYPAVQVGKYRDLTFWRNLKLGTAPYVNPRLLETSKVAFKYDAGKFADIETVIGGLKSGEIAFAQITDDEYVVVPASDPLVEQQMEKWLATGSQVSDDGFIFVSSVQTYKGVQNSGAVVTWSAGPPVRSHGSDK